MRDSQNAGMQRTTSAMSLPHRASERARTPEYKYSDQTAGLVDHSDMMDVLILAVVSFSVGLLLAGVVNIHCRKKKH